MAVERRCIILIVLLAIAACNRTTGTTTKTDAQPADADNASGGVIALGPGPASITKASSDDVVESGRNKRRLGRGPLRFAEGSILRVVDLAPGGFIDINGLKVESGSVEISSGIPRFIENGVMIVDGLGSDKTGPISLRVTVSVVRKADSGTLVRLGTIVPLETAVRCVTDLDGHAFSFTLNEGTGRPTDAKFEGPSVQLLAKELPDMKDPSGRLSRSSG